MATTWFERGRPALFEALSKVCDQIGRDFLDGDVQDPKSSTVPAEDNGVEENVQRASTLSDLVATLKAENAALRNALAHVQAARQPPNEMGQLSGTKPPDDSSSETRPLWSNFPTSSATSEAPEGNEGRKDCDKCAKILRRYRALSSNFKTAKEALLRRKDERNKWIRHAELLGKKIRAAEEQHSIQIVDQKARQVEIPSSTAMEADDAGLEPGDPELSFVLEDKVSDDEPQLPQRPPARNVTPVVGPIIGPGASSQTTQGQASDDMSPPDASAPSIIEDDHSTVKQEPSSDAPEIVSERKVRKRKRADEVMGESTLPIIKSESNNLRSPSTTANPAKFHTQESIDLGDIGQKIQTPRKRQLLEQRVPYTELAQQSKISVLTPAHSQTHQHAQSAQVSRQTSALMPLDANARPTRPSSKNLFLKHRRGQLADQIASLAEDGADYGTCPAGFRFNNAGTKSAKTRLDSLLNLSFVDASGIGKSPERIAPSTPSRQTNPGIPGRRRLPFESDGQQSTKSAAAQRLQISRRNLEIKPLADRPPPTHRVDGQTRRSLRSTSMSELGLDDFKINPIANQGHDFAFSEVVRDKGERTCLPGCVDMHCCGKHFRDLAISQKAIPPLTPQQRQEEQILLERYLGYHAYRLATMSTEERDEVWIQAKTEELANKYGKHRQRYSRMQSPPGFWNADFPDTQQLKADREEAAKRTRQAVAERYREAMKVGGRWKFADE
ncbi:uncharacterized protein UV8b_00407 [Ustilaginoidea virens]|uniref:DNA endonuclease activator Ctp1 C-terminal domain-containing protein n=1 Tax=Ustilaginoidea virens TaxID=1159556 RepID=A0A8E5HIP1_USTVR|nr:uncharacterized protein UV8b_00407 [Ustilaginoidea virens]QUC16166.1 hypothetical protein UV8b_00407 [Ustilaginoidea virens]